MRRILRMIPPVLGVLVAGLIAASASSETRLECSRATGRCDYLAESVFGDRRVEFPIDSVRDLRIVEDIGKNKNEGEVVLVFADGRDLHFGRGYESDARATLARASLFFGGDGATFSFNDHGSKYAWLAALLVFGASIAFGVEQWRKGPGPARAAAPAAVTPEAYAKARKKVWIIVGLTVLLVLGQGLFFFFLADKDEGTLELECRARCRFQGMECLPGGSMSTTLAPGDYPIEIWASSGQALWLPRRFTIKVGETTKFRCEE